MGTQPIPNSSVYEWALAGASDLSISAFSRGGCCLLRPTWCLETWGKPFSVLWLGAQSHFVHPKHGRYVWEVQTASSSPLSPASLFSSQCNPQVTLGLSEKKTPRDRPPVQAGQGRETQCLTCTETPSGKGRQDKSWRSESWRVGTEKPQLAAGPVQQMGKSTKLHPSLELGVFGCARRMLD